MNIKGHFETITRHKLLVMKYCFECGLYEQGLAHDLSKYSPTEFIPGCIYYQGDHSPNEAERKAKGYTSAWLHHKGRNKHHLEYWIDYSTTKSGLTGMKIPLRYVCEMVCDRVAASQIYLGDRYTDAAAWNYYEKSRDHYLLHPETRALLEKLLQMVRDLGRERTIVDGLLESGLCRSIRICRILATDLVFHTVDCQKHRVCHIAEDPAVVAACNLAVFRSFVQ